MMKLNFLLALQFLATASYSQLATLDTFLVEGQLHHLVGMSQLASGDRDIAIDELNLATEKLRDVQDGLRITTDSLIHLSRIWDTGSPVSPVYKYLYGRALQRQGVDSPDTIQSKRLFYEALEIEPKFLWPYLGLAWSYLNKADYASAISLYHKAISIDSAFGPAYNALVEAYTKSYDTSNASKMEQLLFNGQPRSWTANMRRGLKAAGESDIVTKGRLYRDIIHFAEDEELLAGAYNGLLGIASEHDSTDFDSLKSLVLQLPGIQFRKPKQSAYLYTFARARREGWLQINILTDEILRTTDIYLLNVLGKYHADSLHDYRKALMIFQRGLEVCTRENAYNTVISGVFSDQQLDRITERYRASFSYRMGLTYVSLGLEQHAKQYLIQAAMGADSSRIVEANFQLGALSAKSNDSEDAIRWLIRGLALKSDDHAMALLTELIGSEHEAKGEIQKVKSMAVNAAPDF
jgi:tetratricopeptide (TPR) repeat protein